MAHGALNFGSRGRGGRTATAGRTRATGTIGPGGWTRRQRRIADGLTFARRTIAVAAGGPVATGSVAEGRTVALRARTAVALRAVTIAVAAFWAGTVAAVSRGAAGVAVVAAETAGAVTGRFAGSAFLRTLEGTHGRAEGRTRGLFGTRGLARRLGARFSGARFRRPGFHRFRLRLRRGRSRRGDRFGANLGHGLGRRNRLGGLSFATTLRFLVHAAGLGGLAFDGLAFLVLASGFQSTLAGALLLSRQVQIG